MKAREGRLLDFLSSLPAPELPDQVRKRALARARAHLARPPQADPDELRHKLFAYAHCGALVSADVVFLADACIKATRAFGG